MGEITLTLKFRGAESEILEKIVDAGIFNTKSEAIRAALVHYSLELGVLDKGEIWKGISRHPKRHVSDEQLAKDIRKIKEATCR